MRERVNIGDLTCGEKKKKGGIFNLDKIINSSLRLKEVWLIAHVQDMSQMLQQFAEGSANL